MKLLFIFPAIIFFGCETVIPVDIPYTPSLVVDGAFNPDSVWSVKLSLSQHILNKYNYLQTEVIEDEDDIKMVTIRDENNALVESLFEYKPEGFFRGEYKGKTKPEINKTYRLEIETNSYGRVTASGHLPPVVPITSAKIENSSSDKGEPVRMITVEFSDDGNTANFYEMYIIGYSESPIYTDQGEGKKRSYRTVPFSISDPAYSEKVHNNSILFDDTLFSGKKIKFSLKIENNSGNIDRIVLRNITEDLYKLTVNRQLQAINDNNPFAEPVLIKGNIQGGYGIFTGFAASAYPL